MPPRPRASIGRRNGWRRDGCACLLREEPRHVPAGKVARLRRVAQRAAGAHVHGDQPRRGGVANRPSSRMELLVLIDDRPADGINEPLPNRDDRDQVRGGHTGGTLVSPHRCPETVAASQEGTPKATRSVVAALRHPSPICREPRVHRLLCACPQLRRQRLCRGRVDVHVGGRRAHLLPLPVGPLPRPAARVIRGGLIVHQGVAAARLALKHGGARVPEEPFGHPAHVLEVPAVERVASPALSLGHRPQQAVVGGRVHLGRRMDVQLRRLICGGHGAKATGREDRVGARHCKAVS